MSTGIVQSFTDRQKWLDSWSDAIQPLIEKAFTSTGEPGRVTKDLLNGVWLGHPLHPALTDVPIGAWTMSQLFDLLSIATGGDDNLDMAADMTLGSRHHSRARGSSYRHHRLERHRLYITPRAGGWAWRTRSSTWPG